jgi:Protein of unknown function (DUF3604)
MAKRKSLFNSANGIKRREFIKIAATAAAAVAVPVLAQVQTDMGTLDKETAAKVFPAKPHYSPYAGRNFPGRPLFGDTHLHTSMSFDAGMFGARLGPVEAYRFAKGEEVTSSSGQRARLSRPLDFLVVADHSDFMGLAPDFLGGKPEVLADPTARRWFELIREGKVGQAFNELLPLYGAGKMPATMQYLPGSPGYRSAWQATIHAAEQANNPGRFTSFIGYEWTSNTGGNNLHRNVIYRDDGSKASQMEPYTTFPPLGSDDPRDLWKWMAAYEQKTGGRVLAISHNGNVSNGRMFPILEPVSGGKLDKDYALTRTKWERLYEVTQTKGDGETHPFLSPNDEFADFNRWDKSNLDGSVPKKQEMLEFEYARSAYKNGLKLEAELGVNPFKFGLVGSTDAHNSLAAVEEENFFGKMVTAEPNPTRWEHPFIKNVKSGVTIMGWETQAAGYAAVWAQENTRESIFDAMQRRETYATTGPRMAVRFFGGFDFEAKDAQNRLPAKIGYTKGVPMGGDLTDAPKGKAPTFLVAALKDPIGANLDRYQIIKGWLDAKGQLHEKIYDVAWSAGRKPDPKTGKLPSVGTTVDVENATWTNTIGATELIAVWSDPEFDPAQRAFYYGRVIEIPTPRWTAYDAKYFGVKMPKEVPMTTTERAYTSPIWYTPGA